MLVSSSRRANCISLLSVGFFVKEMGHYVEPLYYKLYNCVVPGVYLHIALFDFYDLINLKWPPYVTSTHYIKNNAFQSAHTQNVHRTFSIAHKLKNQFSPYQFFISSTVCELKHMLTSICLLRDKK